MIDYFSLALCHGLLLIGLVRLLTHEKLDHEDVATLAETDAADAGKGETADKPGDKPHLHSKPKSNLQRRSQNPRRARPAPHGKRS